MAISGHQALVIVTSGICPQASSGFRVIVGRIFIVNPVRPLAFFISWNTWRFLICSLGLDINHCIGLILQHTDGTDIVAINQFAGQVIFTYRVVGHNDIDGLVTRGDNALHHGENGLEVLIEHTHLIALLNTDQRIVADQDVLILCWQHRLARLVNQGIKVVVLVIDDAIATMEHVAIHPLMVTLIRLNHHLARGINELDETVLLNAG